MSDHSGSIDSLLANLRRQNSAASTQSPSASHSFVNVAHPSPAHTDAASASAAASTPHGYPFHQPPSSSHLVSSSPNGLQSGHSSAIMSPNISKPDLPAPAPAATPPANSRASSLLSLLKSSQVRSSPQPGQLPPSQATGATNPGDSISASDLVASFMRKPAAAPTAAPAAEPAIESPKSNLSSANQDLLLSLLNRSKPPQSDDTGRPEKNSQHNTGSDPSGKRAPERSPSVKSAATATVSQPAIYAFGSKENIAPKPREDVETPPADSKGMFTYVNPFEQLAASSPRNRTPKDTSRSGTPKFEILKHPRSSTASPDGPIKQGESAQIPLHTHNAQRRKLAPAEEDTGSTFTSSTPAPVPDGRTQLEAIMGIGAHEVEKVAETVAEALDEVGEEVSQELDAALEQAENSKESGIFNGELNVKEILPEVKAAAVQMKKELDDPANSGVLEETLPAPVAELVRETIEKAVDADAVADSWESADAEDNLVKGGVRVYNFPIKPFASLTFKPIKENRAKFSDDSIVDIARLKKEFDQVDRTLVAATKDFVVYGTSKHGGFRLIRQDNGRNKQMFHGTEDRIFNISISASSSDSQLPGMQTDEEAIIATGVSGNVYWAATSKYDTNWDEEEQLLVFPPIPSPDDSSTSGGLLKTRAKKSSRHPEFFAIGRGRAIHIVWPSIAAQSRYMQNRKDGLVKTEKYVQERSLKIQTGKAGKDFVFSEDDSTIASLDKLGRLRIWDVRDLVDGSNGAFDSEAPRIEPIEITTPLITFLTSGAAEKAWPSSVLFVDKHRPYSRGTAQRYLIVGMKQNHTIQLWDLALGKAVQELNFPHESESDAICSIGFNATHGVIIVGHPTRNSIYLVHLSAPRYNLSPISQARYVQRLAQQDASLTKPDATAIMSGVREFAFTNGQLRSLDVLSPPSAIGDEEDPNLFELYAMHSKGVSMLTVKRSDMGWDKSMKVVYPVDAEAAGLLIIDDLQELTSVETTPAPPSPAPPQSKATRKAEESLRKTAVSRSGPSAALHSAASPAKDDGRESPRPISNGLQEQTLPGSEKVSKKNKKRAAEEVVQSIEENATASAPTGPRNPQTPQRSKAGTTPNGKVAGQAKVQKAAAESAEQSTRPAADATAVSVGVSAEVLNKEMKRMEKVVSAEVTKAITKELGTLYERFDEDKRIQAAAGDAKQVAVLSLVSSTLSNNVEKSLARMVGQSIHQSVLPSIATVTASAVNHSLKEALREELHHTVPNELRALLPELVARSVRSLDLAHVVSETMSKHVSAHVEREVRISMERTFLPAFQDHSTAVMHKLMSDLDRRLAERAREGDAQRHADAKKIDQLQDLVQSLSRTVSGMAEAQTEFQNEILKLQREALSARRSEAVSSPSAAAPRTPVHHEVSASAPASAPRTRPEQMERDTISQLMLEGKYEEATIMWLQSSDQTKLYNQFFVQLGPRFLQNLSPLVLLSVAATVTSSFESHMEARLVWLESALTSIDSKDPDVVEVLPRIMEVLVERLGELYQATREISGTEALLQKIYHLMELTRRHVTS